MFHAQTTTQSAPSTAATPPTCLPHRSEQAGCRRASNGALIRQPGWHAELLAACCPADAAGPPSPAAQPCLQLVWELCGRCRCCGHPGEPHMRDCAWVSLPKGSLLEHCHPLQPIMPTATPAPFTPSPTPLQVCVTVRALLFLPRLRGLPSCPTAATRSSGLVLPARSHGLVWLPRHLHGSASSLPGWHLPVWVRTGR